jgi:hypothetical protein
MNPDPEPASGRLHLKAIKIRQDEVRRDTSTALRQPDGAKVSRLYWDQAVLALGS